MAHKFCRGEVVWDRKNGRKVKILGLYANWDPTVKSEELYEVSADLEADGGVDCAIEEGYLERIPPIELHV